MKTAYKGTDKDFKCRDIQFELDSIFVVVDNKEIVKYPTEFFKSNVEKNSKLNTCTNDGIHYCDTLENVFNYYSNNGSNRFFEVEILGTYNDDKDGKSTTTALRFIREIDQEELLVSKMEKVLKLKYLRQITEKFPNTIIGGSVGLYLRGIRLKRLENYGIGDFDLIHPFYINLEDEIDDCVSNDNLPSGCDFGDQFNFDGIKVDLKVDPQLKYDIVEFNGHKYKVGDFRETIEAKIKYSKNKGGEKHYIDLLQLLKN